MISLGKKVGLIVALASGLLVSSCSRDEMIVSGAIAAGAGGYAYYKGGYTENVDASSRKIYQATTEILKESGNYSIVESINNGEGARISGQTKLDDKDFKITITPLTENSSEVAIRFGVFGEEMFMVM